MEMPSLQVNSADSYNLKISDAMPNKDQEMKSDDKPTEFEDAVSMTGHGKFHYFLLVACGLCLISMVSETLSTSYLLPSAQCDFNMSSSEKGLLNAVIYLGMICSSHMWGFLADTRGRHKVLVITLLLDSLCTLVASFMPKFWLFLIFRFFNGIFICGPSAVVFVYLGEFHAQKTRTRTIVWVSSFIALWVAIQPGIAWLVIPQLWSLELPFYTFNTWRIFMIICGMPPLITAAILYFVMPESPKYLLAAKKEKEALEVLRYMYAMNSGNSCESFPVKALKLDASSVHETTSNSLLAVFRHMWHQTKPIFQSPYLLSTLVSCAIQFGLYSSSNGFLLWIPDIFNRIAEFEELYPGESATVCKAVTTLHDLNTEEFEFNMTVGKIHMIHKQLNQTAIINETGIAAFSHLYINSTENMQFSYNNNLTTDMISCNSHVDPSAFQKTLIIGATSSVACIFVGYLITFLGKKTLLVVLLLISGICGIAMYFAQTYIELLLLPCCFIVFSGMCVSVVNSAVVDIFPTNLRAMALCMTLMMGRVGTVSSNLLLGLLLEINCTVVIFMMSIGVIVCGLFSFLLPTVKKATH